MTSTEKEAFRVKAKMRKRAVQKKRKLQSDRTKRRILRRLDKTENTADRGPVFSNQTFSYNVADRIDATKCGGIAIAHSLVQQIRLVDSINEHLKLLKIHRPYHESDHVLNIAYNSLCGATCLDDIEHRRHDEAFMNILGAKRIPDPTTAGDFCRRFDRDSIADLHRAIDEARVNVWSQQPYEFFEQAIIDMDGTIVPTNGECKEGMDYSYKNVWGYHPLIASLSNTGEPLRIINRSGSRPSHEGASQVADECIELCKNAGFRSILLRGDTDFTQTAHLDRWDFCGVKFVFGVDSMPNLVDLADAFDESVWTVLERREKRSRKGKARQRPVNVKQEIVVKREFENIRLEQEHIAEFDYRPGKCKQAYRMIVVRKTLVHERGQRFLFRNQRYFFYLTNKTEVTAEDVVFLANDRCNQENLIEQLKNGVHALRTPVDNLESNWAYMVMTSLAWCIKVWLSLSLPVSSGRYRERRQAEKETLLRMHFKKFHYYFIQQPCQVLRTGRRLIVRLLSWNPYRNVFLRLADILRC